MPSILTQGKEVLFILVWVARSPRIAQVALAPLMNLAGCKQHSQMLSVAVTDWETGAAESLCGAGR